MSTLFDLAEGEQLLATYGTKGNHQLLLSYGFCIPDNVEPDGSSNDVYEMELYGQTVELRAGKKAYTYGPLCRAIEIVRSVMREEGEEGEKREEGEEGEEREKGEEATAESSIEQEQPADAALAYQQQKECVDDGMEEEERAFMEMMEGGEMMEGMMGGMMEDGMMEDGMMEGGMMGGMYESEGENEELSMKNKKEEIQKDMLALVKLKELMEDRMSQYQNNGEEEEVERKEKRMEKKKKINSEKKKYAAIIVSTEVRTLQLFVRAIVLILDTLHRRKVRNDAVNMTTKSTTASTITDSVAGDDAVIEEQATSLSSVFCTIRHPE